MGACQNCGPFLDPDNNTAPNIEGTHKGTIHLTTPQRLLHILRHASCVISKVHQVTNVQRKQTSLCDQSRSISKLSSMHDIENDPTMALSQGWDYCALPSFHVFFKSAFCFGPVSVPNYNKYFANCWHFWTVWVYLPKPTKSLSLSPN